MACASMWYAPDPRVTTQSASRQALSVVRRITVDVAGVGPADEGEERELFAALHVCAYRATESSSDRLRTKWTRRWNRIREHIVERNLGLAYSMMRQFGSHRLDEDDLLSDAMLGLTRAVDRFDPWRGYRFSTYACNVIARALMRQGRRERQYRQVFPVQYDVPYERPIPDEDGQTQLYVERLKRALSENLGALTELESEILANRFPDDDHPRLTFQEIGQHVGLSKERVRQIQNAALDKLRTVLQFDPVLV